MVREKETKKLNKKRSDDNNKLSTYTAIKS